MSYTVTSVFRGLPEVALPALLGAAAIADLRTRRIPDAVTALIAVAGVVVCASGTGHVSLPSGLFASCVSLVCGMILHSLRLLGGGDVKLFVAAAIWLGPAGTRTAALATAILGGMLAVPYLRIAARGVVVDRSDPPRVAGAARFQLDDAPDTSRVPYGVAIAAGVLWSWWGITGLLGGAP